MCATSTTATVAPVSRMRRGCTGSLCSRAVRLSPACYNAAGAVFIWLSCTRGFPAYSHSPSCPLAASGGATCQTQGGFVCCTSGTTCQAVPGTGYSACAVPCNTAVSFNGRQGDFTYTVNIGVGNSFVFQYDARDYPDRFTVKTPSGQVLFNIQAGNPGNPSPSCTCSLCTGVTEPNGQVSLVPPLGVSQVIVVVNGQCSGTVWSFQVGCATTSNPLARTASVSALAPMPELPEEPFLLD